MGSAVVSSQWQRVLFLPNLHPITKPTSSTGHCASHCASSDGSSSAPPNQFLRGWCRLSHGSTLRSECGPSQIQNAWRIDFSSISSSGRSPICRGRLHCSDARASLCREGEFRALDGSSCEDLSETTKKASVQNLQRRELVGAISSWILLPGLIIAGSASGAAAAEVGEQSLETVVPPAKTGLIERLLDSSRANKAKYDQERLDAYYKRNFKDYFEFLKGTIENKNKDTLTEAEKGILNWLEKNK